MAIDFPELAYPVDPKHFTSGWGLRLICVNRWALYIAGLYQPFMLKWIRVAI